MSSTSTRLTRTVLSNLFCVKPLAWKIKGFVSSYSRVRNLNQPLKVTMLRTLIFCIIVALATAGKVIYREGELALQEGIQSVIKTKQRK